MGPWLTALAVGYATIVGTLYLFQRQLIYFPNSTVPDRVTAGLPEMVVLGLETADGLVLRAWWHPPAGDGMPVIVFFHGNAGHLGHRGFKLRPFLDRGYGVLSLAYRGYSGNPGSPTEEGLYADARAALAYVDAADIDLSRVVLYGESLGSGVAVQMASERAVGALVLEAPFSSLADVAQSHYPFLPVRLLVKDRFDSLAKIAANAAPVLVLHGERDSTIPMRFGRRLFEAAHEPKRMQTFPDAGHNGLYGHGAGEVVFGFLEQYFQTR
jgi:fermentation-respiration switch protein FrsA (DUF1100 family)